MTLLARATAHEQRIADALCLHPTASIQEVAAIIGGSPNTVRAHIRALATKIPNPHGLPAVRLIRAAHGSGVVPSPTDVRVTRRPNKRGISPRIRARVLERDGFRCRRCGHSPPDVRLVVDHITPVAKGGARDESNLQTLCTDCNSGKGARDPHAHDLRPFDS